jgi:hypothetical protein
MTGEAVLDGGVQIERLQALLEGLLYPGLSSHAGSAPLLSTRHIGEHG